MSVRERERERESESERARERARERERERERARTFGQDVKWRVHVFVCGHDLCVCMQFFVKPQPTGQILTASNWSKRTRLGQQSNGCCVCVKGGDVTCAASGYPRGV